MKHIPIYLVALTFSTLIVSSCSKNQDSPQPLSDSLNLSSASLDNSLYRRTHKPTTTTNPSKPATPTSPSTLTVGDGKSAITIDGNVTPYAAGSVITVTPGTYAATINIRNLTGVTVNGAGVIIDGLSQSKDGFYNCLNLSNLNNVTVNGFKTQNNGYFMMHIGTRLVSTTLSGLTFTNCSQGTYFDTSYTWDGTDNTTVMLNCKVTGCTFDNASLGASGGVFNGSTITDLIKNLEISNCTISNNDKGEFFYPGAVDGCSFHDNKITNFNPTNNNDNRIIKISGNGEAYNNSFDKIEGHAIALWPASFGSTPKTSHFYNNTITNSRRYAAFEFQEFAAMNISGKVVKSDLVVDGNTVGNINTDHWTGYPGTFIDNYQGYANGTVGGQVTLTNNKGYNWWPVPALPTLWNLAKPTVNSGNTYSSATS